MGHPATVRSPRSPRWDLLGRYNVDVDGRPFLRRWRIVQTPWFAVLLTRIMEADNPRRDPHNHSRSFVTFILSGEYAELVFPDPETRTVVRARWHQRWSAKYLPHTSAHRINAISPEPLWTLVLAGRHHKTWHFWTRSGPVDWRDYDQDIDAWRGGLHYLHCREDRCGDRGQRCDCPCHATADTQ